MQPIVVALLALLGMRPESTVTVTLEAGRDATLIEDPDGALANGAGPALFVGRTAQAGFGARRALLWFDVAAAVPRGAIIESVMLRLSTTPSNPDPRIIRLYRVLADWGEGPSASLGGGGAAALPGDVTWLHTFWDYQFWVHSGGQFLGRASAEREVSGPGDYIWTDAHLVDDVRLWSAAPERNFGWMMIGDETTRQSSKSFASREHPDPTLRPRLEITYRVAGAQEQPRSLSE